MRVSPPAYLQGYKHSMALLLLITAYHSHPKWLLQRRSHPAGLAGKVQMGRWRCRTVYELGSKTCAIRHILKSHYGMKRQKERLLAQHSA